ncbi:hypothetical protein ACTFIW_003835 [Dictyostelium discoideum]
MPNPIPISIPEGPKSDCITKEVQDLLLDDAIEQVLPNPPRIFTMMLRHVLRMLRNIKVSVIAYLDGLLIVGSKKRRMFIQPQKDNGFTCQTSFQVPKENKKSVIKEIRNFLKLDCCSPRNLAGLKGKLIALKDAVIPFRLCTRRTNQFHSQCLTLSNGD